jgi:hypothetical protein
MHTNNLSCVIYVKTVLYFSFIGTATRVILWGVFVWTDWEEDDVLCMYFSELSIIADLVLNGATVGSTSGV